MTTFLPEPDDVQSLPPSKFRWRLHWADSELARFVGDGPLLPGADCALVLSAGLVECLGPIGGFRRTRPLLGYLSELSLHMRLVQPVAMPLDCLGRISEGRLGRDGNWRSAIELPWDGAGPIRLELTLSHGQQLQLQAQGLRIEMSETSRFTESLAC